MRVVLKSLVLVTQCPTLWDPMDYGILQVRILEWVAIPFSRGSSRPWDWTQVSHIVDRFFTIWTTKFAVIGYSSVKKLIQYVDICKFMDVLMCTL